MTKSAQGNDEKALRLERETMLRVIECMRDGVYVVSQDYDIEYVSPILEREYGEWRGLKCYQYFEVRDGVCAGCRNDEVFAGDTIRFEWYSVKNGKTFEVIDTPLANPDGSQSKLEIFRDITDRKRAEKELTQYRGRLERLVEERTADLQKTNEELRIRERFLTCLSEISHRLLRSNDLRTTLPEIVQLLGEVTGVSRRMGEMIDTLLDLSRVSRREMHQGTVDLSALARLVIEDLRQRDPEREVEVAITPGLVTRGDAHLLQLVLENLLGNAWKFTSKKRQAKIEFGVQDLEEGSVFFVSDDGAGFDMDYAAKLFDPFQRLHTDADFEGSGIGLATVFRIVHRHGGHVWAEAEINRGARFFFTVGRACPDDSPVNGPGEGRFRSGFGPSVLLNRD